jgi:hypothetical protein
VGWHCRASSWWVKPMPNSIEKWLQPNHC